MNVDVMHRIMVKRDAHGVAARIERRLGLEVEVWNEGDWGWSLTFLASPDVDLDFLRPDVLPPRDA